MRWTIFGGDTQAGRGRNTNVLAVVGRLGRVSITPEYQACGMAAGMICVCIHIAPNLAMKGCIGMTNGGNSMNAISKEMIAKIDNAMATLDVRYPSWEKPASIARAALETAIADLEAERDRLRKELRLATKALRKMARAFDDAEPLCANCPANDRDCAKDMRLACRTRILRKLGKSITALAEGGKS